MTSGGTAGRARICRWWPAVGQAGNLWLEQPVPHHLDRGLGQVGELDRALGLGVEPAPAAIGGGEPLLAGHLVVEVDIGGAQRLRLVEKAEEAGALAVLAGIDLAADIAQPGVVLRLDVGPILLAANVGGVEGAGQHLGANTAAS